VAEKDFSMTKKWIFLSLALLLLSGGCRSTEVVTPTPVATTAPTILPASMMVVQARLVDLLNNPSNYEGLTVQVTGNYRRLPRLICEGEVYTSPATWSLVSGEVVVQAAGFEAMLRPPAGSAITLTVEGRWQRWQGPVGCGKDAAQREIWYLDVSRIVSPNPIVHVTPLPGQVTEVIVGDRETATPLPGESEDPAQPGIGITPLPPGESELMTPAPATPDAPPVPSSPTPTVESVVIITPTPLATPGLLPGSTETAVPLTPGTTPTATVTITATATVPADGGIPTLPPVDKGTIAFDRVIKTSLEANTVHRWQFTISTGAGTPTGPITVTLAPDVSLDVALTVRNPQGETIIDNQNTGGAGQPETASLNQLAAGNYEILIRQTDGTPGSYALALLNEASQPLVFAGSLTYGQSRTANLPEDKDHMWHFQGTAGQSINIVVRPQDNSELSFGLFGPTMQEVGDWVDKGGPGEVEQLLDILLPETGFYSIWIQEELFEAAAYEIQLTRN
jgi:hypothetical protein